MKLMFDLPEREEQLFLAASDPSEKRMYCLPFNIEGKQFVNDGYMVFTDQFIYKILHGEIVAKYAFANMKDFATEIHYGSCGFYAKLDGATTMLCRFVTGRHMPRYTAMIKACELLAEKKGHAWVDALLDEAAAGQMTYQTVMTADELLALRSRINREIMA
jgi:hypothetical protein